MSSTPDRPKIAVIGGGAAGFFAALAAAEANPSAGISIYEATAHPLAKVRISGGGRCNVTHACYDPAALVQRYPRGSRELRGPFHRFGPAQTVEWFTQRGVALKTEADGRMFPVTNRSETVIDCLTREAERLGVRLRCGCGARDARALSGTAGDAPGFHVDFTGGESARFDRLILATGGTRGSAGLTLAAGFGHTIERPVPSLFTFHLQDSRLQGLEGVSVPTAQVSVPGTKLSETGPMLITHWGLSGPAILRLSAWGARELAQRSYAFPLQVSWVGSRSFEQAVADLVALRQAHPRRLAVNANPWDLPARLWERLLGAAEIPSAAVWTTLSNPALQRLARQVVAADFSVTGKSMNKEEFVTCGGVRLREVDFRTMQSRRCRGLFFAGELLDIDGITGGFNFQAAWTTGWIAGRGAAEAGG